MEEENKNNPSPVTMILYLIDNGKRNPSQNWEIIPKKKYTIGRSKKEVDLPLNIKLLSRKHAELIYYNSETIMVKDLGSRNGTFINKLKIEPNRESFFTNKQALSFGNTENEILFFDNKEQNKEEVPKTDSEKSKDSDNEREEIPEKKSEINRENENENENIYKNDFIEEVNTDIKHDIREEKSNYSENNQRREKESNSGDRRQEEKININSKDTSKKRELNRENGKNNELSLSNKVTFQNKKPYSKSNSRGFEYNSQNIVRRSQNNDSNKNLSSHHLTDKSRSREKERYPRSRSGSRETLVQQSSREQRKDYSRRPQEISIKNKDNYSYNDEIERERSRERDRQWERRSNYERTNKYKIERDIEEDKYMMRKKYEDRRREEESEKEYYRKRRELERERERDRDYDRERDRERDNNKERERNYNDRRRENDYSNYLEEGSKIILRPDKLDIVMEPKNETSRNREDNKDEDMGYIKCYVEGYMYLKIRKNEYQSYK